MFGNRAFAAILLLLLADTIIPSAYRLCSPFRPDTHLAIGSIAKADEASLSKLYRSLIGRSEAVRTRTLERLPKDPRSLQDSLHELVAAAKHIAEETEAIDLIRPSTVELIDLIGKIESPETETLLIELLDAEHIGIAMTTADVLGRNKFYGAIEALKQQTARPDFDAMYAFRFNLVRSLVHMEHPDAFEYLAKLEANLDGQLRFHIEQVLKDVTVDDFLGDQARFDQFRDPKSEPQPVQTVSPGNKSFFKTASAEPESLNRMRLKPQQYYGIEIHALRLMFIIDHSGSMKDYWGGMTRLERAKAELARAISELPEDAEFAIVFYHTSVRHWKNDLVPATEQNKREALQFVRRLGYGDRTNTYGALRYSLDFDSQLEAVFLLTDGRPTIGEIISKPAIIQDILHRNRFRHLNFNTIGIAVDGSTRAFLQALAKQSNGEFRQAN